MRTFVRHHRSLACVVVSAALFSFIGCGGPSPTAPTDASPAIEILADADVLHVGESVDMMLRVVFSDGRHTLIKSVLGTDRPDVVRVKPLSASREAASDEEPEGKTGVIDHMLFARVTGVGAGDAWVTADSRYGSCRRAVRVIAD